MQHMLQYRHSETSEWSIITKHNLLYYYNNALIITDYNDKGGYVSVIIDHSLVSE